MALTLDKLINKYKKDIEDFEIENEGLLKEIEKKGYLEISSVCDGSYYEAYDIGVNFGEYYEKHSILQHLINLKGESK